MLQTLKPTLSRGAARSKADRHFVTALSRGLELLACFRHGERMLGNQDLARRCGLPKSTVSRLTHTLTKLGYLVYVEESAKYSLGTATLSLGSAMLARLDIRKLAHPLMQELAEFSQCMVSLGTRDRLSMIYIDVARGSRRRYLESGYRLAHPDRHIRHGPRLSYRRARKPKGPTSWNACASWQRKTAGPTCRLASRRRCATSVNSAFAAPSANGKRMSTRIAVPVRPGGGLPPMAINCGAPAYMVSKDFLLEKVRPRLIALANELEASLGTLS